MFENIPKRWNIFSLNDLATIITGNTPPKNHSEYYETEDILWVKPSDLSEWNPWLWETEEKLSENARKVIRILPVNSVLVSCIGTIGKIGIAPVELATNQQINSVIFNDKIINFKYGYYAFKYYKERLANLASNAVVPIINKTQFSTFKIPVPSTLEEQQEIVDVLDAASEIIRLRTACIESAQDLIPALFQEMFKNYENDTISLSNICDIKGGKRLPQGEKLIDEKTNHPYIRVTNFKNQSIDMSDIKYITEEVYQKISRYVITTNDIYISIAGTIGLVGDIPNELNNANLTENAAKLIINKKEVNKKYLMYCLNSPYLQQQIKEATVGVGVPKLALARIGALKVYLPPIKLQEQFAQKAIEIESYIKEQEEERDNARQMFQSLLHHAFTGELTRHKFGDDANG